MFKEAPPMRLAPIVATCALAVIVTAATAEEVDHPAYLSWSRCPVGTSVMFRSLTEAKGNTITTTTTTLKQLKPDAAVLEIRKVSDATGKRVEGAPRSTSSTASSPCSPASRRKISAGR